MDNKKNKHYSRYKIPLHYSLLYYRHLYPDPDWHYGVTYIDSSQTG